MAEEKWRYKMVCEAAVFNMASVMAIGRKVVEVVEEGELLRSEERKRKDHELRKIEMFLKTLEVPEGVVGDRGRKGRVKIFLKKASRFFVAGGRLWYHKQDVLGAHPYPTHFTSFNACTRASFVICTLAHMQARPACSPYHCCALIMTPTSDCLITLCTITPRLTSPDLAHCFGHFVYLYLPVYIRLCQQRDPYPFLFRSPAMCVCL